LKSHRVSETGVSIKYFISKLYGYATHNNGQTNHIYLSEKDLKTYV